MHRLQISLPHWQTEFLAARARRDGTSVAAVVRALVEREADTTPSKRSADSLWEIAGIAEDRRPLRKGVPVSERPEEYLADLSAPKTRSTPASMPRRVPRTRRG